MLTIDWKDTRRSYVRYLIVIRKFAPVLYYCMDKLLALCINVVLNTVPSAKVEHSSNCLSIQDGRRLVVCDLESRWVSERPRKLHSTVGETRVDCPPSPRFTMWCIKWIIDTNAPITSQVELACSSPSRSSLRLVMRESPHNRPTLLEEWKMVEAIPVGSVEDPSVAVVLGL